MNTVIQASAKFHNPHTDWALCRDRVRRAMEALKEKFGSSFFGLSLWQIEREVFNFDPSLRVHIEGGFYSSMIDNAYRAARGL